MIDPDNAKDSILDELLWTEKEFKEIVRQAITRITNKMAFIEYGPTPVPVDTRRVRLHAAITCPGGNQPEVFAAIRRNLDGMHIAMTFDNRSNEDLMKIAFEAPRWRPFDGSAPAEPGTLT